MNIILKCLWQTAAALLDVKLWGVFLLSLLLNIAVWIGLLYGTWDIVHDHPSLQIGWINSLAETASMGLAVFLTFLLFPLTLPLIITLFEETISIHIDRKSYGVISTRSAMNSRERVLMGVKFFAITLGLNLLFVPFYFVPVLNVVLYYAVNGYLLGREFFEMVASRHVIPEDLRKMRKKHRAKLIAAGMIIVFAALVPVLNLFVPILAVVFMVHFYYKVRLPSTGY